MDNELKGRRRWILTYTFNTLLLRELKLEMQKYIEYYNNERIKLPLKGMSVRLRGELHQVPQGRCAAHLKEERGNEQ